MKHVLSSLVLVTLVVAASACGHDAVVRSGGRVTLVEPTPEIETFAIDRGAIDHALAKGAGWFIRQVGLRPVVTADERFYGFQLMALFPGEEFDAPLPIRVGDIVQQINGHSIERPEQFMAVWNSLATTTFLSIRVMRKGNPLLITWAIRDTRPAPAVSAANPAR